LDADRLFLIIIGKVCSSHLKSQVRWSVGRSGRSAI